MLTGTIIGTRTNIRNWSLQIVDGKVQFSLYDTENTATITSPAAINDGQWHHIAAVRDAAGRLLHLYIDHVEVTPPVVDTATKQYAQYEHVPIDPVYLGAFNTLTVSEQVGCHGRHAALHASGACARQVLRFRAGQRDSAATADLSAQQSDVDSRTATLAAGIRSDAILQRFRFVHQSAAAGAIRGHGHALDGRRFGQRLPSPDRQRRIARCCTEKTAVIGPYWIHKAEPSAQFGSEWWVHNKTDSVTNSFDFVQNTGVFTMSTFVNMGAATGGYMTIFDTSEGSHSRAGLQPVLAAEWLAVFSRHGRNRGNRPLLRLGSGRRRDDAVDLVSRGRGRHGSRQSDPVLRHTVSASTVSAVQLDHDSGRRQRHLSDRSESRVVHRLALQASKLPAHRRSTAAWSTRRSTTRRSTPAQIQQLFLFGKGLPSTGTNQPPIVDLNGTEAGQDYETSYELFGGPILVTGTATITDVDNVNLGSVNVTLDSPEFGDLLSAYTSGTQISASFDGATLTLSGVDAAVNYQQVLRSIRYDNTAGGPSTPRTVHFVAIDENGASSAAATTSIAVPSVVLGRYLFYNQSGTVDALRRQQPGHQRVRTTMPSPPTRRPTSGKMPARPRLPTSPATPRGSTASWSISRARTRTSRPTTSSSASVTTTRPARGPRPMLPPASRCGLGPARAVRTG